MYNLYTQPDYFAEPEYVSTTEILYNITWEGRTLHELGGYSYLAKEQIRLEADRKRVQTIANGQLILTGVLALAALIASLYYLLEILKWFLYGV